MSFHPLMRTLSVFSLLAVLLVGCAATSVPFENIEVPASDSLSLLTVRASKMTCSGCVNAVSTAIEGVPGVVAVDGDIDTKEIFIIYDIVSGRLIAHYVAGPEYCKRKTAKGPTKGPFARLYS